MRFSRIITGILITTILFAQTDKGKEQSRPIPKKFNDGHALELIKNQMQFNSDEEIKIPGYGDRFNNSGINHGVEDDIIIEQGISIPARRYNPNRSVEDTLAYYPPGGWRGQSYLSPGEAMFTTFKMPSDGTIKGINVPVYEWGTGDQQVTITLYKMSYPYATDGRMYPSSLVDSAGWIGGYDMDNTTGYMSIGGTTYSPGGTQGICDTSNVVAGAQDPLGVGNPSPYLLDTLEMGIIWPLNSYSPATLDPTNNPDYATGDSEANWIILTDFGSEVEFLYGDWIGILVAFTGDGGGEDDATGFFYAVGTGWVDPWVSAKFNRECSGPSGNGGWHIRSDIFNFQLAVELLMTPPAIDNVTVLHTTVSTESRPVTAQISHNFPEGGGPVASATIHYQLDSLTAPVHDVPMELANGDSSYELWEGEIPGQSPGTGVYWYLTASEEDGATNKSESFWYFIFEPTPGNDLIFLNQKDKSNALYCHLPCLVGFYFYWGTPIFDVWFPRHGPLTDELLMNYDVLIELTGGDGPIYNNDDEVGNWWNGDKIYIVAGDEWLGKRSGYTDGPTEDGSVAKNILGIAYEYNDINYTANGDQSSISRLTPVIDGVASSLVGFLSDSLLLNYDPDYETGGANWIDGVEAVEGYTVDMTAYSLVLDSAAQIGPPEGSEEYNVMIHGQAGNGGKSAFMAFDPIALNTVPSYYWVGASYYWNVLAGHTACPTDASPLVSVYEALKEIVSVEDDFEQPTAFSLRGNYPNPFNPVTNIQYVLHTDMHVEIRIYDVLGRGVKTLLNAQQTAGEQIVQWDSRNDLGIPVAAGVYLYQIQAGEFVQTKKMVLLK